MVHTEVCVNGRGTEVPMETGGVSKSGELVYGAFRGPPIAGPRSRRR
jgi:hypothetical protein